MNNYLALLAVTLICCVRCKATPHCDHRIASTFLDAVVDFLVKGKHGNSAHSSAKDSSSVETPANITRVSRKSISIRRVSDCSEYREMGYDKSGVYTIWPASRVTDGKSLQVYCDMQQNGGGWTVIQRRGPFNRDKEFFEKGWKSYKEGFGDIEKDFWLGNDNIFALTNQKLYSVRFDLKDVANQSRYAQYDKFWIDDEDHQYTLHIADYEGDAGDSMIVDHNNQKFSTPDKKNDHHKDGCAQLYKGGWWYNNCHHSNLNGWYLRGKHDSHANGVNWLTWKGYKESLESTEIKIRPKNFKLHHVTLITPM